MQNRFVTAIAPTALLLPRWLRLGLWSLLLSFTSMAHATWSVVAVDPTTGEVGAAGATCYPGVAVIAGVVPGQGAVVAQGLGSNEARDFASKMLQAGSPAQAVVDKITSSEVDTSFFIVRQFRQYGVASLHAGKASVASATGFFATPARGSREAAGVSVQGNILASPAVLDKTLEHFVNTPKACGMAMALLNAMEAGAREGGDARCSAEQSALSAFVFVAQPNDAPNALTVRVIAPDQKPGERNPVLLLRERLRNRLTEKSMLPRDCGL